MRRRVIAALLLLLAGAPLAGCWDLREMNHLALVMAVGIDKMPENGRFQVTVQIARPGSQGKVGSGGAAGGTKGDGPVYTAIAEGDTIFTAIRNLAQFVSRRVMWAHNSVVVIGESLAREDITPVIDFFTRNKELRMRSWMVVARGSTAREIVAAKNGLEQIPADSVSALLRYASLPGESVRTDISEVAAAYFSPMLHPVISAVRLRERALPPGSQVGDHGGNRQVQLRGTAVFHRNRLVGFVEADAGRGLLWLRGELKNAVVTLPCPGVPGKMAVEIRSPSINVRAAPAGRQPVMQVTVRTEAWLTEQDCETPQLQTTDLKAYASRELTRAIEGQIRAALTLVQTEYRTDVIKYAQRVRVDMPGWWHANESRWAEVFPQVRTEASIAVVMTKMSLYARPMQADRP